MILEVIIGGTIFVVVVIIASTTDRPFRTRDQFQSQSAYEVYRNHH